MTLQVSKDGLRPPLLATLRYPFAAAPDIIRSHQKDAYFEGFLVNQLSNVIRGFYGVRTAHKYATEVKTFSELLYLSLTTLIGNRTLGEEYCDIVQVEDDSLRLPDIFRRGGYIMTAIILPYSAARFLPAFRAKIRCKIEANLHRLHRLRKENTFTYKLQAHILDQLSAFGTLLPIHAITLMAFYFSGAYYQLSKRLWGLRYIFTRKLEPAEARVGYEVLGMLLLLQMLIRTYKYSQTTISRLLLADTAQAAAMSPGRNGHIEASPDANVYSSSHGLPPESTRESLPPKATLAGITNTVVTKGSRYDLKDGTSMRWVQGKQQRRCTLCLEELKDSSAAVCGHVFCWVCIGDWIREKPECPLCRRETLIQHVLPLRC